MFLLAADETEEMIVHLINIIVSGSPNFCLFLRINEKDVPNRRLKLHKRFPIHLYRRCKGR